MITVLTSGSIWFSSSSNDGVRPVLSLKNDVLVYEGDGTTDNPYIVGTPRT